MKNLLIIAAFAMLVPVAVAAATPEEYLGEWEASLTGKYVTDDGRGGRLHDTLWVTLNEVNRSEGTAGVLSGIVNNDPGTKVTFILRGNGDVQATLRMAEEGLFSGLYADVSIQAMEVTGDRIVGAFLGTIKQRVPGREVETFSILRGDVVIARPER